jgi:hypothetical protein
MADMSKFLDQVAEYRSMKNQEAAIGRAGNVESSAIAERALHELKDALGL